MIVFDAFWLVANKLAPISYFAKPTPHYISSIFRSNNIIIHGLFKKYKYKAWLKFSSIIYCGFDSSI